MLAEAVQVGRDAVATSTGHPDRAGHLNYLGNALQRLFERTGDTAVLAEAVQAGRDAVAATPAGHPNRATVLSNLGGALRELAERTGDTAVLAEAVQAIRDAVAATPTDHPSRAGFLSNLGNALQRLFERTGDTAVLAEAVQAVRDAVAATPTDHTARAGVLSNLGGALRELAERTGDTAVLAEAVQAGRDAIAATPTGHPDRATSLTNLGNALRELAERTGDTAVLAEAVQAGRDAVAATPAGHSSRAGVLSNLGVALRELAERTGDTAVLAEAVQAGHDAIAETRRPPRPRPAPEQPRPRPAGTGRTHRGHRRAGRGGPGRTRCRDRDPGRTPRPRWAPVQPRGRPAGTGRAHRGHRRAGRGGPGRTRCHRRHSRRPPRPRPDLNNLGLALQELAERTGDTAVLAEAVQAGRDAVTATPVGHPARAGRLSNLGAALQVLADRTRDTELLAEAGRCFTQAAQTAAAPSAVRISAYLAMAGLPDPAGGSPQEALAAVEAAVGLLPQVVPRALVRADREYSLGRLASLAAQAAAVAVTAGRPGRAVELLEQTRGVLVADTLDARSSDLTRLRGQQPGLAGEFDKLRARIDALDHPGAFAQPADPPGGEPDLAQARRDAHAAWHDLIARIRAIGGFENFLQPPDIHQLASHARGGPVVFTYTSPSRCDALILTDDPATPVRVVPLTDLTEQDAYRQANRLLAARQAAGDTGADPAARIAAQTEILDVLAWMWDTLTGPVLAALGHITTPAVGQPWPRVWWCPVGILAYLPLHSRWPPPRPRGRPAASAGCAGPGRLLLHHHRARSGLCPRPAPRSGCGHHADHRCPRRPRRPAAAWRRRRSRRPRRPHPRRACTAPPHARHGAGRPARPSRRPLRLPRIRRLGQSRRQPAHPLRPPHHATDRHRYQRPPPHQRPRLPVRLRHHRH